MSSQLASAKTRRAKKKRPTDPDKQQAYELPPLPSILTQPLGLEGWTALEPVLLAALASEEPLLLVGPHGSAKSFLLERLAQALNLDYRFYNASLINYDDLVGIPMPSDDRKSLQYISTPSAIWDSEVVFFDEINRTRPELQNKLFPIVHERRVQGIQLQRLRYRWSAMNPPPVAEGSDETADVYLGAEPLDPALADRFCFVLEVPGWQQLTEAEKRRIFRDQFDGGHPFRVPPADLVARARERLQNLQTTPPRNLEDYLLTLLAQLEANKVFFSARRATMFHRNILAVHAARETLYETAFPDIPPCITDWSTSALVALQNSLPQLAQGRKPDSALLLAAHRHAWEVSRLDAENPWRELLQIKEPFERCVAAIRMGTRVDDSHLSQLILDALAEQQDIAHRKAVALTIYLAVHRTRDLQATVYETLAQELRPILEPGEHEHDPDACSRVRYRQVKKLCAELDAQENGGQSLRIKYGRNLLQGLLDGGFESKTPRQVYGFFCRVWDQLIDGDGRRAAPEAGSGR